MFWGRGWNFADREHNFGLVRADLTPKPSYFAMAGIAAFVRKAQYVGRIDTSDPDIWILKFRLPAGKDAWAIWNAHEDDDWQVTLHSRQANPEPVLLCRVGNTAFERPWGMREWRRDAPLVPNEFSLLASEMPWLVIGDLSAANGTAKAGPKIVVMRRAWGYSCWARSLCRASIMPDAGPPAIKAPCSKPTTGSFSRRKALV